MAKRKQQVFGVVGVIVNGNSEVLLTKRHEPQNPDIHHKWQLPGGGIEFGENTEETIIRELMEEIGCKVKIVKLIPYTGTTIFHRPKTDTQVTLIGYVVKIISGKPRPTHYETAEVKWIKPEKIDLTECLKLTQEFLVAGKLLKR